MDMMTLRRRLMQNVAPLQEYTATGNPASFLTDIAKPLKGLSIPFMPKQSGSGDPSPSNIRPITGWTGLNIYRSGEDTSDPLTIPVSWQTEAGEVYGGTLDALTGVLAVIFTHGSYKWKDMADAIEYNNVIRKTGVLPGKVVQSYASDKMRYCNIATFADSSSGDYVHFQPYYNTGETSRVRVFLPKDTDAETVIDVVTELAEPYTIQLDPVALSTLKGTNVLWTDTNGNNTVKYLKRN